jgi:hypothetical protein
MDNRLNIIEQRLAKIEKELVEQVKNLINIVNESKKPLEPPMGWKYEGEQVNKEAETVEEKRGRGRPKGS